MSAPEKLSGATRCVPRATVRLQIHAGFDLDAAAETVPYHAALGISHLYVSPLQRSRSGSTHGYDGIDPRAIDAERGGRAGLRRLVARLRAHDMGLILDIVPNHLGTSLENPWWFDVLECGRASAYADFFAIDWNPPEAALCDRVLAPFLADEPAAMIASGTLRLRWDEALVRIVLDADGQAFPVGATTYAELLDDAFPDHAASFRAIDGSDAFTAARAGLAATLREPPQAAVIDAHLARTSADAAAMQRCLDAQAYALAHWRDASTRINWRRFFDISELIALRTERDAVFDACHALVFELYAAGEIDGVRIDHVDGLADPRAYCRRLRAGFARLESKRPADAPQGPAWIVVEKILDRGHETLATDWTIDGSTGYDFMDEVGALLHDASAGAELDAAWREAGGRPFATIVADARREILAASFVPDFERLLAAVEAAMSVSSPATPAANAALRAALTGLVLRYPRYRGYAGPGREDPDDRATLAAAGAAAVADGGVDAHRVAALVALLGGRASEVDDARAAAAISAFQQLTPPLAARALEDTAFYRYVRLLSRNEVGADPSILSIDAGDFHRATRQRAVTWPHAVLGTASHDHKRGEDARMRIASLTDIAPRWRAQLAAWRRAHAIGRADDAPDAIDALALYQTLLGAWPTEGAPAVTGAFITRIVEWQRKAIRERKQHGDWQAPDEAYEAMSAAFVEGLLAPTNPFVAQMSDLVAAVGVPAALRSLAQVTLRCTVPGIPDLYQGTEFWDDSMVDPDNRSEVDYDARRAALVADASDADLLAGWRDGRVKQRLIARLLGLRRSDPTLFGGAYRELPLRGAAADRFLAFARVGPAASLVVVVPIRPAGLADNRLQLRPDRLGDTSLAWPAGPDGWNAIAQKPVSCSGSLALADLLGEWPLAAVRMPRGDADRTAG